MSRLQEIAFALKCAPHCRRSMFTLIRIAFRSMSEEPLPIHLPGDVTIFLRGSRGVRVSDLSILYEVTVRDHYNLNTLVSPGAHILDIGGHIGIFGVTAALRAGPDGKVLSVEATPQNHRLLKMNSDANNHLHHEAINVAASNIEGLIHIEVSDWNTGGHRTLEYGVGGLCIPCQSLEQLLDRMPGRHADIVKIDCEGCEFPVLNGASSQTLQRVETYVVELHEFEGVDIGKMFALETRLSDAGFSLETLSVATYPGEGHFKTIIARRQDK